MEQRTLSGRYILEERIGSGGMAEVFKARDKLLDRPVAVKILHAAYRSDIQFVERFRREAQAAAKLCHPNIVSIYDVGQDGSDQYIVMEYVRSKTLKDKIRDEGPLNILTAVSIANDIANGLCHAHANNIVHCDIKPHNILMTSDGHAKIADFGIARAVTESTMTYSGNVIGSVHYLSPEQAQGSTVTTKSDVYSLGVVMYEMLTNHLPFTGDNAVTIAMKHVEEEPVPPNVIRSEIPAMLEAIVLRTMSKNPELRPTSLELIQALVGVKSSIGTMRANDPDATQFLPRVTKSTTTTARKNSVKKVDSPKVDEETSKDEKKSSSTVKYLAAGVFILVLFGVGSFMAFGNFGGDEEVPVPNVMGKQMTLAQQILEGGSLRVNVAETYDANVPAGQVVSQDPDPGRSVKVNRLVTIYVSKGGETIDMPDLVGLSKTAATERITKVGLKIGKIYEKDSYYDPVDKVLEQDPVVGTKINRGQTIDLTVAKGGEVVAERVEESSNYTPDSAQITYVPDVYNDSYDVARSSLESRGLHVGSITYRDSDQADGTVLSQSLSPESSVEIGASVDLVLSRYEKPQTYSEEPEVFVDNSTTESYSDNNYYEPAPTPTPEPQYEEPVEVVVPSHEGGAIKNR